MSVSNSSNVSSNGPSGWDARHRAAAQSSFAEPACFVSELLPLLPTGPALDLACGAGRHTLLLAARRQDVTAVDNSVAGLDILEQRARDAGVAVSRARNSGTIAASRRGIDLFQADLERAVLPADSFALVLCVQYLQRSLFDQIARSLVPGGMLLFETYTLAQLEFPGGPRSPEHLLEQGELRTAFPTLRLLFYRELRAGKGIASLIAQKPFKTNG
jgi:tellurite methyltransferase